MNREQILAKRTTRVVPIEVPEWGGTVHLRGLTVGERDRIDQFVQDAKQKLAGFRSLVLSLCLCDADGKRLFNDGQRAELDTIDAGVAERLFTAAMPLAGIAPSDLKDLEGNSGAGPCGSSSSGSPATSEGP
jgi:hypothetical protein